MLTRQWITTDKSSWGDGPWQAEPDKIQWEDSATGLPCLVKRNQGGALCGYVGVPEGHLWYRQDYNDVPVGEGPHGGLTYADHCQDGEDEAATICHIPAPGEPDNVWWLGFDCAHAYDLSPATDAILRRIPHSPASGWPQETYRTLAYVQEECRKLAQQIAGAA